MDTLAAVAEAAHAAQQQQHQAYNAQGDQFHLQASSSSSAASSAHPPRHGSGANAENNSSSGSDNSDEEEEEAYPLFRSAPDDEGVANRSQGAQKRRRIEEGDHNEPEHFRMASAGSSANDEEDDSSDDEDDDDDEEEGIATLTRMREASAGDPLVDSRSGDPLLDSRSAASSAHSQVSPPAKRSSSTPAKKGTAKRKRTRDPNAPQRPKSAYNYFVEDMRGKVQKQILDSNPHLNRDRKILFSTTSSTLAETWKQMDPQWRQKYEDLASEDRRRYEIELENYRPDPWMDESGKIHDPNAPKKPMTAFVFFSQERRQQIRKLHPEMALSEISKRLGHEWNALSEEQKKPYADMAAEDKQRFQREMENYRAPRPEDRPEWLARYEKAMAAKEKEKRQKKASAGQQRKRKKHDSSKDSSQLQEFKKEEKDSVPRMSVAQKASMKYLEKRDKIIKGYQKHLENLFFDPWRKRYSPCAVFLFAERNKDKVKGVLQGNEEPFKWLVESQQAMTRLGATTARTQVKNLWDKLEESSKQDYKYLFEVLRDKHPSCVANLTRYEQGWDRLVKSFTSALSSPDQLGHSVREIYDRKYPIPSVVKESLHPSSEYRLKHL
eukprot:gb/GECG01005772.1/.p1 GENE.gb/GECG01005772.1/~~gb/GECG01005772.1/.p1  ORF type:complete len:609 (+),score=116.67 gb/GECG01005772.1/:1-1827(+)